jgi:hypothetical protein
MKREGGILRREGPEMALFCVGRLGREFGGELFIGISRFKFIPEFLGSGGISPEIFKSREGAVKIAARLKTSARLGRKEGGTWIRGGPMFW